MAQWPRTVYGNVLLLALAIGVILLVLLLDVSSWSGWVWASTGSLALALLALSVWRRRVEAARERAWEGSFSFAEVVARRRAEVQRAP